MPVRAGSNGKRGERCRDASWVYVGLGVSDIVAGFLVGVVYFSVRTLTTSLEHTEVIPTYANAIMAVCSGIIIVFVYKRKDKLLLSASIVMCLLCGLICATSAVLVGLNVVWTMHLYKGCVYNGVTQTCQCFMENSTSIPNAPYADSAEREYVYEGTRSCRVIQRNLLEFVYMAVALYVLLSIVNMLGVMIASTECKRVSDYSRFDQEEYMPGSIASAMFPPILGLNEQDLDALRVLGNWNAASSSLFQDEITSNIAGDPRNTRHTDSNNEGFQNVDLEVPDASASTRNERESNQRTINSQNDVGNEPPCASTSQNTEGHTSQNRHRGSVVSRQVVLPGDNCPRLLGIRRLDGLPHGVATVSSDVDTNRDSRESRDIAQRNESVPDDASSHSSSHSSETEEESSPDPTVRHDRQNLENIENEMRLRQIEHSGTQTDDSVQSETERINVHPLRYNASFARPSSNIPVSRNHSLPLLDPVYANHINSLWNLQLLQLLYQRHNQGIPSRGNHRSTPQESSAPQDRRHVERGRSFGNMLDILSRPRVPLSRSHSEVVNSQSNPERQRTANRTRSTSLVSNLYDSVNLIPEEPPPPYSLLPSYSEDIDMTQHFPQETERHNLSESESDALLRQRRENTRQWVRRMFSSSQGQGQSHGGASARIRRTRPPLPPPSSRRENENSSRRSNQSNHSNADTGPFRQRFNARFREPRARSATSERGGHPQRRSRQRRNLEETLI